VSGGSYTSRLGRGRLASAALTVISLALCPKALAISLDRAPRGRQIPGKSAAPRVKYREVWKHAVEKGLTGRGDVREKCCIATGKYICYYGQGTAKLVVLDRKTGQVVHAKRVDGILEKDSKQFLLTDDGKVYLGGRPRRVFNMATGEIVVRPGMTEPLSKAAERDRAVETISVGGGSVFYRNYSKLRVWTATLPGTGEPGSGSVHEVAAYAHRGLYAWRTHRNGSRTGTRTGEDLHALDKRTGEVLWRATSSKSLGLSAEIEGVAVIGASPRRGRPALWGLDARTGAVKWGRPSIGGLMHANGRLLHYVDRESVLRVLDAPTGEVVATMKLPYPAGYGRGGAGMPSWEDGFILLEVQRKDGAIAHTLHCYRRDDG